MLQHITNDKIATMEPKWASFPGFSLLFDAPSDCFETRRSRLHLRCDLASNPCTNFYQTLHNAVQDLNIGCPENAYSFCPLPLHSYHVTVWGGGNLSNWKKFSPQHLPSLQSIADLHAAGSNTISEAEEFINQSELIRYQGWNIRFRYGRLEKSAPTALVARLFPDDDYSAAALLEVERLRIALIAGFEHKFGVRTSSIKYGPHVSVGYFANLVGADAATPKIGSWDNYLCELAEGRQLTFNSISLYGFSDMTTFYKRPS
jgi:hypothetical protein